MLFSCPLLFLDTIPRERSNMANKTRLFQHTPTHTHTYSAFNPKVSPPHSELWTSRCFPVRCPLLKSNDPLYRVPLNCEGLSMTRSLAPRNGRCYDVDNVAYDVAVSCFVSCLSLYVISLKLFYIFLVFFVVIVVVVVKG